MTTTVLTAGAYWALMVLYRLNGVGGKRSIVAAVLAATTLFTANRAITLAKRRWPDLAVLLDGAPQVLIYQGRMLEERITPTTRASLIRAAMENGIGSLSEIEYALRGSDGGIQVISREQALSV